MVMHCNKLGCN